MSMCPVEKNCREVSRIYRGGDPVPANILRSALTLLDEERAKTSAELKLLRNVADEARNVLDSIPDTLDFDALRKALRCLDEA